MFEGSYNSPYLQSAADRGGQRVLGMRGSLTNYINTGRTGAPAVDTFEQRQVAKQKKKESFKAGVALTAAAGAVVGAITLYKKGKLDFIKNIKMPFAKGETIGEFFKQTPEKAKKAIKENADKEINKMKDGIKNQEIKNDINKVKEREQARVKDFREKTYNPKMKELGAGKKRVLPKINVLKGTTKALKSIGSVITKPFKLLGQGLSKIFKKGTK